MHEPHHNRGAQQDRTGDPQQPGSGKEELKHLEPQRIQLIESIENEAGTNSKGNARVMFSPNRHNGAIGIVAVVKDAKKGEEDLFPVSICSAGWCN